jgi:XTP/dITP diphosphohydrolase
MSHPIPDRIVIATHNEGKLREFAILLRPYAVEVTSAGQLGLPSPEETGDSFAANAVLKAKAAALATGLVALADDSGLCVEALGGQPGIFSARWGDGKNFAGAMERVQRELGNATDRRAHFICVLALCWPDGHSETIEGRVDGTIAPEQRGAHGHGYDPVFIPNGYAQTFAEMGEEAKNAISHRGRATKAMIEKFFAHRKK